MTVSREAKHAFWGGLLMALLWTLVLFTACSHPTAPAPPCEQRYWPPYTVTYPDGTSSTITYPMAPLCPRPSVAGVN